MTNPTRQAPVAEPIHPPRVDSFNVVAEDYDARFTDSSIGRAQRDSVWRKMDRVFRPGQRILEINCGTGVDALHLAAAGIHVVACDASNEMIRVARRRLDASAFRDKVEFLTLPTELICNLEDKKQYDGVLSNFAGLNCVADLRRVAGDLARLVKPGGKAILCLFGRFCIWETVGYAMRGDWQKAFRRLSGEGTVARLGPSHSVLVHYPSVDFLRREFSPHFRLEHWMGVGVAVPPSYLEPWVRRWPRLFRIAAVVDPLLGRCPGLRHLADHALLVLERTAA